MFIYLHGIYMKYICMRKDKFFIEDYLQQHQQQFAAHAYDHRHSYTITSMIYIYC